MLRIFRYVFAGMALLSPAACTGFEGLARQKADSLSLWADGTVPTPGGPVPIRRYVAERTAFVAQGVDGIEVVSDIRGDRSMRLLLDGRPATAASGGVAVAVDADGYWLTAAHCVERTPVLLVPSITGEAGAPRGYPCRVVWSGKGDLASDDLALVHAAGSVKHGVLALGERAPENGVVLCRGSGIGSPTWSAGRITSVGGAVDGSAGWFEHSTPLGPGDSGGPAVLADGTLGGIVVRGAGREEKDRSTAAWLSPSMLRRLIDDDKMRGTNPQAGMRRGGSGPSGL